MTKKEKITKVEAYFINGKIGEKYELGKNKVEKISYFFSSEGYFKGVEVIFKNGNSKELYGYIFNLEIENG